MSLILHLDFNSFFASVEQQANPFLRGKPIAVTGKGHHSIDISKAEKSSGRISFSQKHLSRTVITTASIEAKKCGIKTAMPSTMAKQLCPDLTMISGDPKKYAEITHRFLGILRRHCDAVEQFSTDEAFADISSAKDSLGATLLAQLIRNDIKREIGSYCTASIGIAPNKLLAKLAGESVKPNGLTVLSSAGILPFLDSQPLSAICGIGPRIETRLHNIGITTMRGLRHTPLAKLIQEFKPHTASFLYFASRGIGDAHISSTEPIPKSVGHSYTFAQDLITEKELRMNTLALCDRISWRMRKKAFHASTISIFIRYHDFSGAQKEQHFKEPLKDGLAIYKNAWRMIDAIRHPHIPIRLIGISVSNLQSGKTSIPLFLQDQKQERLLSALDKIQETYGSGSWQRAATLPVHFKERISGWHYDHEG